MHNRALSREVSEALSLLIPQHPPGLAWVFFVVFAKLEFALKGDARFLMPGRGKAEANWDRFASEFNDAFVHAHGDRVAASIAYFKEAPVRKQLRRDGTLEWSDPIKYLKGPLLVWLLLSIRAVRNNLFHGGKFGHGQIVDPVRDTALLDHSLAILLCTIELDERVKSNFTSNPVA